MVIADNWEIYGRTSNGGLRCVIAKLCRHSFFFKRCHSFNLADFLHNPIGVTNLQGCHIAGQTKTSSASFHFPGVDGDEVFSHSRDDIHDFHLRTFSDGHHDYHRSDTDQNAQRRKKGAGLVSKKFFNRYSK